VKTGLQRPEMGQWVSPLNNLPLTAVICFYAIDMAVKNWHKN